MPPISHLKFIRAQFLPVEKIVKRFFYFFRTILLTNTAYYCITFLKQQSMPSQNTPPPPPFSQPKSCIPHANVPDTHLVLAILTTLFCCLPFGLISLVYSIQAFMSQNSGNMQLAEYYSSKALYWGRIALWCGAAMYIIYFLFFALPIMISGLYNYINL